MVPARLSPSAGALFGGKIESSGNYWLADKNKECNSGNPWEMRIVASTVVMTGGGIKGAVAAGRYATEDDLLLVHLSYGQRSAKPEQDATRALAAAFPSAREVLVDLPHVSQLQRQIERKETASASQSTGIVGTAVLSATTLSGLMPVLCAVGLQCALRAGASRVVAGLSGLADATHLGLPPREGRPDHVREFVHGFQIMLEAFAPPHSAITLETPLIDCRLADIVKLAARFDVPWEKTWTCERSGPKACGRCVSCGARARAFADARLVDPAMAVGAEGKKGPSGL